MKRLLLAFALVAALLCACGGGGGGDDLASTPQAVEPPGFSARQPASCAVNDQKTWLRAYMQDYYFWHANLADGDASGTVSSYFSSLLYKPLDRYSYTQSASDFNQTFSSGTRTGYGYNIAFVDSSLAVLRVRQVEPGSPAEAAGLRRGDYVLTIDGFTPQQIALGAAGRVSVDGVRRQFVVRGVDGRERSFSALSSTFALQPAQLAQVWTDTASTGGAKVGYLAYHQFISAGEDGLHRAFEQFSREDVRELILDLRYNGGGSVSIARGLASAIGGTGLSGQTFTQLRYSDRHPEFNQTLPFTIDPSVLAGSPLSGLRRVFVVTTRDTASASEMLINSLKPFMEVVLIGGDTYGKPFGFRPIEACATVFNAVNFEAVNARGEGGYVNGLAATCPAADDLDHALGNQAEASISTALEYLRTGSCPVRAAASKRTQITSAPGGEGQGPGMWRD